MSEYGNKNRPSNEKVVSVGEHNEQYGSRYLSPAREKQIHKLTAICDAKRKQSDRRTLLSMIDRLEVMAIEAKYLELSNHNEDDVQCIIDSALKAMTEFGNMK